MKKFLTLLLISVTFILSLYSDPRQLYLGFHEINGFQLQCWDNCCVRAFDKQGNEIIFHTRDILTSYQSSYAFKLFLKNNDIKNQSELLAFFDNNDIYYFTTPYGNSKETYIDGQAFFEEYLVPLYNLDSGYSNGVNYDKYNWSTINKEYETVVINFDDRKEEYLEYDGKFAKQKRITYTNGDVEVLSNFDEEHNCYVKSECLHQDGVRTVMEGYQDGFWQTRTRYYPNKNFHKYSVYNKELNEYETLEKYYSDSDVSVIYSSLVSVPYKDNSISTTYSKFSEVHKDFTLDVTLSNWNKEKEIFDKAVATSSNKDISPDVIAENYTLDKETFLNQTFFFNDKKVVCKNLDEGGFWDIDVYDNNGKVIAYCHTTKKWNDAKGVKSVNILSDTIVYKYTDISQKGDKIEFKTLKYKDENGKVKVINNGSYSINEFYKKALKPTLIF